MKRLIALILVCALLVGCTPQVDNDGAEPTTSSTETQQTVEYIFTEEGMPEFTGLDDSALLTYMEDSIYTNLITELDNEMYFVENVSAVYISKEYLEEVAYNSQENIYFGYTLSELDAYFQGTRYVFTLGNDGQTIVTEFQEYDDTYEQILKNVAIGTGVILICVTVSVVSGGLGAPAVSMIFAASAKTGTIMGLSSGLFSGVSAGVVTGMETGDFDEAMKAAALAGSEGFKWGAITGSVAGGAGEAIALKGATLTVRCTKQRQTQKRKKCVNRWQSTLNMEAVMRKKYDIPEISIYRFLKPERREQIKPQDRHNRPYTKKDTEYWAKFERKKTD